MAHLSYLFIFLSTVAATMLSCTLNGKITSLSNNVVSANALQVAQFDDGIYGRGITKSSQSTWTKPAGATTGTQYQLALGSTQGATDIVSWMTVGDVNTYTFNGLNLDMTKTYYTSIRVIDKNNQAGPATSGDGWEPSWVGVGTSYFPTSIVHTAVLDNQGKILIGGQFITAATPAEVINYGVRLNSDASRDTSFNYLGDAPTSTAIQSDGKIVVVGLQKYNGIRVYGIVRINADGSKDESFNTGTGFSGGFNNHTEAVAIQSDGKILVGGSFTNFNGTAINKIARLNADGSLDTSFIVGTGFDNTVKNIAFQSDGKAIVAGSFTSYQSTSQNYIVRINTDGSNDASFAVGTNITGGDINVAQIQSDGMVVIGGNFTTWAGSTSQNKIMRLTALGARDASFNIGTGFGGGLDTKDILIQSDGKILVTGNFTTYNGSSQNGLVRLNTNGTKDATFNVGTGLTGALGEKLLIQSDGKVIVLSSYVSGGTMTYNGSTVSAVIRVNTTGGLDATFNTGEGFNSGISEGFIQPDGKIVVFGNSTTYGGTTQRYLMRLNADGTKDTGFNTGTEIPFGTSNNVSAIVVQTDDKILIGGNFTSYNGNSANRIARLNSDGSFDSGFNIGTGFGGGSVDSIVIQPDGKILVGGSFTTHMGLAQNCLIRLNSDGTKDASFNIGTGCAGAPRYIRSIALQTDGKVLIGGSFTSFNGSSFGYLNRLNSDGSIDSSFSIGPGGISYLGIHSLTWVTGMGVQPDGKILAFGNFISVAGNSAIGNIRLDSGGSIDATWNVNSGAGNSSMSGIPVIHSNGSVLFGAGNMANCFLNPDGTVDNSKKSWIGWASNILRINDREYFVIGMYGSMTNASNIYYSGFLRDSDD